MTDSGQNDVKTETRFIPGPWSVPDDPTGKGRSFVTAASKAGRVVVCQCGFGHDISVVRATAQLIRSAPELYKLLGNIEQALSSGGELPDLEFIRQVLVRAGGATERRIITRAEWDALIEEHKRIQEQIRRYMLPTQRGACNRAKARLREMDAEIRAIDGVIGIDA